MGESMEQKSDRRNKNTAIWMFVLCCVTILLPTVPLSRPMQTHAQELMQLQEMTQTADALKVFREKKLLLRSQIAADLDIYQLSESPAGEAGYAVFLSVCDKISRADVYCGTGADLESAWQDAVRKAEAGIRGGGRFPVWVKADVVNSVRRISSEMLRDETTVSNHEFYRYGIALDKGFQKAFLEEELNGAKIYDYENGALSYKHLRRYLKKAGRAEVSYFPDEFTLFECCGWFCDEDGTVFSLIPYGPDKGRREVKVIDREYAENLIRCGADYLSDQIQEDGSFLYGIFPRFNKEIEGYSMVRHAGTLWSLVCRYRMNKDPALKDRIDHSISYMTRQIIYDDSGAAYLPDESRGEIKLGGLGTAVIALSEYIDAAGETDYLPLCTALGQGILNMMDIEKGTYWHVLNEDFSRKEEFRIIYYDGEATFALVRLYALTGDRKWLDAACAAVDHFIEADYEQYMDHWVAYAVNELTKYVEDRPEYYAFGLLNAWSKLHIMTDSKTTHPVYLELLMASFELYDRMVQHNISTDGYDAAELFEGIKIRANRQLNSFFYPEYAMYMTDPQSILNTFMVREHGYRVRIDDVQHNIGGYYLYKAKQQSTTSIGAAVPHGCG